jgi:hypothetical protein
MPNLLQSAIPGKCQDKLAISSGGPMVLAGLQSRVRGLLAIFRKPSFRGFSSFLCALCASAFVSSPVFAQSCPLCYDQAAQAGAKASRAIGHGILFLLIPTLLLFVGVLLHAVRRANSTE